MTKLNQSLANVSATDPSRIDKDLKNMKSSRAILYKWSNCMARKINYTDFDCFRMESGIDYGNAVLED